MTDTVIIAIVLVGMTMLGGIFGSFACCQAWRWRYYAKGKKSPGKWSACLHCKKRIQWYDNIPIVSWLVLGGRCRYCRKKIGVADFLSEVGLAAAFLMLSWAYLVPILENWVLLAKNPQSLTVQILAFVMTLLLLVVLTILAVYDAKWGELPTVLLVVSIVMGAIVSFLKNWELSLDLIHRTASESLRNLAFLLRSWGFDGDNLFLLAGIVSTLLGVVILSGTCFVIYKASHEKMMGGGDWLLALALALALSDWWLALWTIFLSNLLGDVIALPGAIRKGKSKVYFGPFLVSAFVIVLILGNCLPLLMKV